MEGVWDGRCVGWKEGVCGVGEGGGRERREVHRVEGGEGGCRCVGWREEGVCARCGGRRGRRLKCACHCTVIFPN